MQYMCLKILIVLISAKNSGKCEDNILMESLIWRLIIYFMQLFV